MTGAAGGAAGAGVPSVAALLAATVVAAGDRPAVVTDDGPVSWVELDERSREFAGALVAAGIGAGDRVAIWAPNGVEWIVAVLGLFRAGAVLVPVNTRFKGTEAAVLLERSGAKALITATDFLDTDYVALLAAAEADLPALDLTVIARSRASEFGSGADWLYTYLRGFYRDSERPTGWNNVIFENVGMPHVLYELQGEQVAKVTEADDGHGGKVKTISLEQGKPGKMSKEEYDKATADLVSYLVWMGEPMAETRKTIGTAVLAFLGLLFVLSYLLKKNYWKDIH